MAVSEETKRTNQAMLLGVRFVLQLLGVAKDGLLARFVEQEFQAWTRRVEKPVAKGVQTATGAEILRSQSVKKGRAK